MSGGCWLPADCTDWAAADALTAVWAASKQMRISAVTFGCAIDLLIVIIVFLLGLVRSRRSEGAAADIFLISRQAS
jgi:hypothetical protein